MLVAATDSELDELRTTLQPVYADLAADPATKAYLDAISALKRELAAPPRRCGSARRRMPRRLPTWLAPTSRH